MHTFIPCEKYDLNAAAYTCVLHIHTYHKRDLLCTRELRRVQLKFYSKLDPSEHCGHEMPFSAGYLIHATPVLLLLIMSRCCVARLSLGNYLANLSPVSGLTD